LLASLVLGNFLKALFVSEVGSYRVQLMKIRLYYSGRVAEGSNIYF